MELQFKQSPLGVEPKWSWEVRVHIERINAVTAAIQRYLDAGYTVPTEWIQEMLSMPELPTEWVDVLLKLT